MDFLFLKKAKIPKDFLFRNTYFNGFLMQDIAKILKRSPAWGYLKLT